MTHKKNVHHSAPSSSYSMTPAPRLGVAHDDVQHNATMGNCSGLMTSSLPPPYRTYREIPDPQNKPHSRYLGDPANHPPLYTYTKMPKAEQSIGKHHTSLPKRYDDRPQPYTGNDGIVSKTLNLFRDSRKEDKSDHLEWPPRGTKYITDPSLPLRQLVSPFNRKFQELKAQAKTQEEWDELRRRRGDLQSSSSRNLKSGKPPK